MLDNLQRVKHLLKVVNGSISLPLSELPPDKLTRFDLMTALESVIKVTSYAILLELVHQVMVSTLLQNLLALILIKICSILLDGWGCFTFRERLYFHFELVASSILVFDVLGRPEALELTVNHDPHFGAQSFSFFHRMSRNNHSTFLSQSRNFGHYVPHKSLGLGVDSGGRFIQEH